MNNKQSRYKKVFAFIDSQNLNMGVGSDVEYKGRKIYSGWKLDFKKFRIYLKDKFKAEEAFLFIGNKPGQESKYAEKLDFVSVNKVKLEELRATKKTSIVLPDAHSKVARHGDKQNIPPRKKKVNQGKKK